MVSMAEKRKLSPSKDVMNSYEYVGRWLKKHKIWLRNHGVKDTDVPHMFSSYESPPPLPRPRPRPLPRSHRYFCYVSFSIVLVLYFSRDMYFSLLPS